MQKQRGFRRIGLSLFCLGAFLSLSGAVGAATFTVLNTDDSGADSLRAAITAANAVAGPHTIQFNIPGAGPHVIGVLSQLPDLVQTMTIDGYSQPGSSPNTNPFNLGLNTVLRIALDGTAAGLVTGLRLAAPDIEIRGLAMYGFGEGLIRIEQPRAVIAGNFLGTNLAGTGDPDGLEGGGVDISLGGDDSVIGGNDAADRNVISGFVNGIYHRGPKATIRNNLIGTDLTGNTAIPNFDGILCQAVDQIIEIDLNLISGNTDTGVLVLTAGTGFCRLTRNYIGTNVDSTLPLGNLLGIHVGPGAHEIGGPLGNIIGGNQDAGILITAGDGARLINNGIGTQPNVGSPNLGNGGPGIRVQTSTNIQIGDTHLETNVLRFNGGSAIEIDSNSTGIRVGHSTIFENGGLAIDLNQDGVTPNDPGDGDGGANFGQNFPEIVGVEVTGGQTTVSLELDGAVAGTYRIQLHSSLACDPSGFGEGAFSRVTEDVVTDASGDASFSILINGDLTGEVLTATATDPDGNTSEFSRCALVLGPASPPVVEVPSLGAFGLWMLAACLALAGLLQLTNRPG